MFIRVTSSGDFTRQDSTISDPDEYVCIHDINQTVANINALITQRTKRAIFNLHCHDLGTLQQDWIDIEGIYPPTLDGGDIVLDVPIYISAYTNKLRFNVRAARTKVNSEENEHYLYPVILPFDAIGGSVNYEEKITIDIDIDSIGGPPYMSTSYGNDFTVDISVPTWVRNTPATEGFVLARFVVLHEGSCSSSTKGVSANNITSVGDDWFQINAASTGHVGDAVVITSNTQIEPRIIIGERALSTGTRYTIDKPWNIKPQNTDTWDVYIIQTTQIESMSLYEVPWTGLIDGIAYGAI